MESLTQHTPNEASGIVTEPHDQEDTPMSDAPTTMPLAPSLFGPFPPVTSVGTPAMSPPVTSIGTPAMSPPGRTSSVASSPGETMAISFAFETPALWTPDGKVPDGTWSMRTYDRTPFFGTPATDITMTLSSDEDSEDYDLIAVIRKESAKRIRQKESSPRIFRPGSSPIPPAFRTANIVDLTSFPNFLISQPRKQSVKDTAEAVEGAAGGVEGAAGGIEDAAGGLKHTSEAVSQASKAVDKDETRKKKRKHRHDRHSSKPHHHHHHHQSNTNNTDTNNHNNKEGNVIGASQNRPIVLDDSGDEGDEATTRPAKKVKAGESLSLTSENVGALEGSSQKSKAPKSKSSKRKRDEKTSRHQDGRPRHQDKRPRHQEERPRSSHQGMDEPAGDTSKRAEKAARKESNATKADKAVKPNEGSRQQTAASAANAAVSDAQTWPDDFERPAGARPTPISTIIGPAPTPKPAPPRVGPTRPITHAPVAPVLPNTQDNAEFRRKRAEDSKKRQDEIEAKKAAREGQNGGNNLPADDAALFQAITSRVPQASRTTIVNDLPSNNFQRPETVKRAPARKVVPTQRSTNIFAPPPRATAARRPVGRPRGPAAPAPLPRPAQDRSDINNYDDDDDDQEQYGLQPAPARRPAARSRAAANTNNNHQSYEPPPPPTPRQPQPLDANAIAALEALGGPGCLVYKFNVCRTKPFVPQGVETRANYKVEIGPAASYRSAVANDNAKKRWAGPKTGVAGSNWHYVVSRKAGAEVFDGTVKYKDGRVQYFWVEEGVVDLEEVGDGVMVDAEKAEVMTRWRWDVVSVHLMKKKGVEEETEMEEVVKENGQVLVIDCGGEEDEGQGQNEHGEDARDGEDGDLWGEGSTAVATTANDANANTPTTTADTPIPTITGAAANAAAATTTTPLTPLTPKEFLDTTETITTFHTCFSNATDAKKAALETFLQLAKPKPTQSDEEKHLFEYTVAPYYRDTVSHAIETDVTWNSLIEWEPAINSNWDFYRLTVQVTKTELKGPLDISDLVVEEPVPSGGTAAAAAPKPAATKTTAPAPQTQPAGPAAALLRPSTPPPPSPEQRWVSVAPATAPEQPVPVPNSAPGPNTTAPAAGNISNTNQATTAATANTSTTNLPPNPAPIQQGPPPVQAAAAGATTPPFAQKKAAFAMVGDDESEVSEEE